MRRLLLLVGFTAAPALVLGPPLPLTETQALGLHALVGAGAAMFLAVFFSGSRGSRFAVLIVAVIAIFAEVAQTLTPNRSSDPLDAVAGIVGAAVGAVLVLVGRHLRARLAPHGETSRLTTHPPRRNP